MIAWTSQSRNQAGAAVHTWVGSVAARYTYTPGNAADRALGPAALGYLAARTRSVEAWPERLSVATTSAA